MRRVWTRYRFIFFGFSLLASLKVFGNDISGYIGAELRYFPSSPVFSGQSSHNDSLTGYFEAYRDFNDGDQRIALTAFARVDSEDNQRSHADIRELYWWQNFDAFELYVGARKIFWGVTESVHLVDIVNQSDTLENIDTEDKLGQPMIQVVTVQDWGTLEAFILPYFREREFPGKKSRLRPGLPVLDEALFQDDDEQAHTDYALRWSHYVDVWDFGVSYFSGTNRSPVFVPVFNNGQVIALQPYYAQINQVGVDLQATIEAWLFKLETILVDEQGYGNYEALAGGIEYTFYTIASSNADLGLIAEYQFSSADGAREPIAQNDIVLGGRWAFNDLDASEVLFLVSQDLDHSNRFYSLELSRRLNDDWKLEAEFRVFDRIEPGTPEFDLRDDDYLQLELRRYF